MAQRDDEPFEAEDETIESLRFIDDDEPPLRFADDTGPLPHWTEPPTGEQPGILAGDTSGDDLEAWSSFATQPVWRDERGGVSGGYDDRDLDELVEMTSEHRLGALDERPGSADRFFDDDTFSDEPVAPVTPIRTRGTTATSTRPETAGLGRRIVPDAERSGGRNVPVAVGVGVALAAVAFVCFSLGAAATVALVTVVSVVAGIEMLDALRRGGHEPAVLVGVVAIGALPAATYWRGVEAMPLICVAAAIAALVWFTIVEPEAPAVRGIGATLLGVMFPGLMAAYAVLIVSLPNGIGALIATIACTVGYDVGGWFVGSATGRTHLAPEISPNKTTEGLVGGMVLAVIVGAFIAAIGLTPFDSWRDALALGAVVACAAPLGDLAESRLKRDLGVKDLGTLLPGHGGVFDRFDALLFALPAAYGLCRLLNIS